MNQKVFITLLYMILSLNISIFGQEPQPKLFEGTMHAINLKNLDNKTIAFSSGIGYNGNEKITYTIKDNFILITNHTLHYYTLWDSNAKTVTVWSNQLKEGKIFDLNRFVKAYSCFTDKDRVYLKSTIPGYNYKFGDEIKIKTLGEDGYFLSGRLECLSAGVDMEYAYCKKYIMPYYMNDAQIYGFNRNRGYLITKYRFTIDNRVLTAKFKGYQGQEITEINPHAIDISAFATPNNIKFKESGLTGLHSFFKKLGKALKKNNLFPSADEVTYEINENESLVSTKKS